MTKIMEFEQKWLREQNELVNIVKEREIRANDIKELNDKLIVLTTKKMRTESKIESKSIKSLWFIRFTRCFCDKKESIEEEQANVKNVHRSLDHIRLDIEKLNKFIDAEGRKKENLINDLKTTTSAFQKSLKVAAIEIYSFNFIHI